MILLKIQQKNKKYITLNALKMFLKLEEKLYLVQHKIIMLKTQKTDYQSLKLPNINKRTINNTTDYINKKDLLQTQQKQNDLLEVTKLDQWSLNRPAKKTKTTINSHNISFLYRNSNIRKQATSSGYSNYYKFMDIQLFIAKLDNQLQKIGEINYVSIYKNLQYCSGVYENNFNALLRTIAKHISTVQTQINQIQFKLQIQRQEHLKKVHELKQNLNQQYKGHINQVRQSLQQKQKNLKPLKKLIRKLEACRQKVLKYCLSLGYDVRGQGLLWIIKQLGYVPNKDQFPQFLSEKQINFIITKYTNEHDISHVQTKMKPQIMGKTINQAYEYVNRRKKRQLSLIKENQQMIKMYADKIKNYSPDKHAYLYQDTLQIAQSLEKDKPKPTKYEVIYKQATKKLNKICKQKIHNKLNQQNKQNKQNNKPNDGKQTQQLKRRKQKRNSTLIIQEFSQMLNLSIKQTKKLEELYTKQERQFDEILRQVRVQKYIEPNKNRGNIVQLERRIDEFKVRNPISILGCLVGWKKAEKVIQQQMLRF